MTGVIEAAGDVASGAVWGRAVEPAAGETTQPHGHGACLNCGTMLVGAYCHGCGQSAHVHRTLMSILHDLLHGVFHFEGKIWRTIPMLVLHPGQLTRRYIAGERARFVSPLALFLFTVFLMFATFSALGPGDLSKGFAEGWSKSSAQLDEARAQTAQQIAEATRERAQLAAAGRPTTNADQRLAKLRDDADALAKVRYRIEGARGEKIKVTSSSKWLDARLEEARANPGLVIYKVQSAAYKFSWALIFLSTPLVALLFMWKRRFGLYDHATFVTYSISFMSLLVIAVQLLAAVSAPKALTAALLFGAPPVHMFAQLRSAYTLSIFSAAWRTIVLLLGASFALALFVLGVVALEIAH